MPAAKGMGIAPDLERPTGSRPKLSRASARAHPPRRAKGPRPERAAEVETDRLRPDRLRTDLRRGFRFSSRVRRCEGSGFASIARPRNGFRRRRLAPTAGSGGWEDRSSLRSPGRETGRCGGFGLPAVRRFKGSGFASIARPRNGSERSCGFAPAICRSGDRAAGFASMPGSRRRSVAAGLLAERRQAARVGRFGVGSGPTEGDGGAARPPAEPGDGERRGLALDAAGLFEARRPARAGRHASETGHGQ